VTGERRFELGELSGADDTSDDALLGQALSAARALEAARSGPEPRPSPGLADRIMAGVAREPAPRAIGILAALRRRPGLGGFADSLRVAWERAIRGGRPMGRRAGALAYVAMVAVLAVSLSGAAAYGAFGALGLLGPPASHGPDATQGQPTPGPLVSPQPSETESVEPSETPEPGESAEPSEDDGPASSEPGDDDGGSASSEPGNDGGESDSETQTPEATKTLKPGDTPRPTESPSPTSSDD